MYRPASKPLACGPKVKTAGLVSANRRQAGRLTAILAVLCSSGSLLAPQQSGGSTSQPKPHSIILPEANPIPDKNDQMKMDEENQSQQDFDKLNDLRSKQIADEATKLLVLANDLKAQMNKLGDQPMTARMMREAEVIELLAHDVQLKMTLTVGTK